MNNNSTDISREEGNKLIAEFMDFSGWQEKGHLYKHGYYDSSWDWLMPVVEKIESMNYNAEIENCYCYISQGTPQGDGGISFKPISVESALTKKEATWKAVIQFIQWYNLQPNIKNN